MTWHFKPINMWPFLLLHLWTFALGLVGRFRCSRTGEGTSNGIAGTLKGPQQQDRCQQKVAAWLGRRVQDVWRALKVMCSFLQWWHSVFLILFVYIETMYCIFWHHHIGKGIWLGMSSIKRCASSWWSAYHSMHQHPKILCSINRIWLKPFCLYKPDVPKSCNSQFD